MCGEPVVRLLGGETAALVGAIPRVERILEREIVLVGGLAVLARLGSAYRVTSDVDTVSRRAPGEQGQLDILLENGASKVDAAGAFVPTEWGDVRIDVLEFDPGQLEDLPEDPTDRLYLLGHDWALRTATKVLLQAERADGISVEATVRVAEPGPLVVSKLQALPNRARVKEATDLLDIVRLTLDQTSGPAVRRQLAAADAQLRSDAALHVRRWFAERSTRSVRMMTEVPAGREIDADTVGLVGELLTGALAV